MSLLKLKKLVLEGGFDEESRQQVADLEARLQRAIAAEKLALNPVIQDYIGYLTQEIARCDEILKEDETATEPERMRLQERKKQCRRFLSAFGQDKAQIEETINHLINVAENKTGAGEL